MAASPSAVIERPDPPHWYVDQVLAAVIEHAAIERLGH